MKIDTLIALILLSLCVCYTSACGGSSETWSGPDRQVRWEDPAHCAPYKPQLAKDAGLREFIVVPWKPPAYQIRKLIEILPASAEDTGYRLRDDYELWATPDLSEVYVVGTDGHNEGKVFEYTPAACD